jgi:UDP-2,4-diacetamido-2,4,6-trideoxy-beta-L-altropyranose hydrolase
MDCLVTTDIRVAFRTDASSDIGTGHVMRCLTLAEELKKKAVEVLFVCRELPGHLADYIEEKGFLVSLLPTPDNQKIFITNIDALPHAKWLGTTWEQDAQETYQILNEEPFWDWLIVDHYALDVRWEKVQRSIANNIMVIDDLADRQHDCDILLDQNLYEGMELRYQNLVPGSCKQLIGPKYALLRQEFRKARLRKRQRDGSVTRVLIFLGGVDSQNMTGMVLESYAKLGRSDIKVDVVLGKSNPHRQQIERMCEEMSYVQLHVQIDYMAELMSLCDLAIGAGGSTNWERFSLGLPSILISIAHNQEQALIEMDRLGLCRYIGRSEEVNVTSLETIIDQALHDSQANLRITNAALDLMNSSSDSFLTDILWGENA